MHAERETGRLRIHRRRVVHILETGVQAVDVYLGVDAVVIGEYGHVADRQVDLGRLDVARPPFQVERVAEVDGVDFEEGGVVDPVVAEDLFVLDVAVARIGRLEDVELRIVGTC